MKFDELKEGLVITISVVKQFNPIKTEVKSIFFENIDEGREFAKNNTTISKEKVYILPTTN